jgi:putative ABC transport system permease protein
MLRFLRRRKNNGHEEDIQLSGALIEVLKLIKAYKTEAGDFIALRDINLDVDKSEFVAVIGKSGSGKTTLVNMITGIDHPTEGYVYVDEIGVHALSEGEMARWRGDNVGVVFQFFQLLPTLTVIENVMLPMDLRGRYTHRERYARAMQLLDMVGIRRHAHKLPSEVSGGEQQRVAIARALANDPSVIVADEPTGNLDSVTSDQVFGVFETLVDTGRTVLIVTHDADLAGRSTRTLSITDGEVAEDYHPNGLPEDIPEHIDVERPDAHDAWSPAANGRVFERWRDSIPGTRWRKIVRDLWDNKARTILVVLAIAVGVFAFGGMFITREVALEDMNSAYAATNPADIQIYGSFDEHIVRVVSQMPGVVSAEGWGTYWLKMQSPTDPEVWYNMDLYAVGDYEGQNIGRIERIEGPWPPGPRQVFFERATVPVVGAQIGDMVTIEMPDGSRRELEFAGIVYDVNAVPPALSLWPRGYVSMDTLQWLGQDGSYSRIFIDAEESYMETPESAEALLSDITGRLERSGVSASGYVNTSDEHWAADVMSAFAAILVGIGVFALILSGFLVVNTTSAVITQQKRQIGMMKAVGASGGQVMGVYLTMVSIFGLLSLLVAVPMGLGIARLSLNLIAGFLNIDITHFRMPLWVLGLQILTALIVPAVAALIPILTGTRVSVRQTISDYGIGLARKRGLINRLLARIRGLPRPTMLSLRNTFRRKGRLALTLITLTLAGCIFIAVLSVRGSLMQELDNIVSLFNFDIQVGLEGAYRTSQLRREAMRVPGVSSVEGWAFAQAELVEEGEDEEEAEPTTFTIYGPPADTPFIQPNIVEGRWLEPGDQNAIVLSTEIIRDHPEIGVGDDITLDIWGTRRRWHVVGILNTGFLGDVAYANFDYLGHVVGMPGQSWVLLAGTEQHDPQFQLDVARALEERLKRAGIGVSQSLTTAEIMGSNVGQFNFIIGFMLFMALLLAVVGGLGLAGTMSLNVLERTREVGVMQAIGASNGAVRGVVLVEGITIGFLSWLLALPLSIPLSYGFNYLVAMAFFERPMTFTFSIGGLIAWLIIVTIISTIASLLPARRAARMSVREALAYE